MTDQVDDLLGLIDPEPSAAQIADVFNAQYGVEPLAERMPDLLDGIMARVAPPNITNKFLRMLVYGDPGVRKTSFCATAPTPLIYETDTGGSESLLNRPETSQTLVLPFKSTAQLNGANGQPGLLDSILNNDPRLAHIETLVIDTYTMYQAKDLAEIPRTGDGKPNYLVNTENLKLLTDKLRNIPMHLILTAHVKEEKDQTTGVILRRPDLTPKVSQAVIAMMGIIGYMTLDGDNWQLQLQPSPGVAAKCRVGGLPASLPNPDFNTILTARNQTIANNGGL